MKPFEAFTNDEMASLGRDNIDTESGAGLLLNEDHVSIHYAPGKWIEIPREDFRIMAHWYLTGQFEELAEVGDGI